MLAVRSMEGVVSLLPATTEIVAALGLAARLVGRSHECDHPPQVRRLPALTQPKLDPRAPSGEIDRSVRKLVEAGLSIYRVDADRLRALRPAVILTQEQCEVCAVTPRDLEEAAAEWLQGSVRIVSLEPNTLDDVLDDWVRVANALGVGDRGLALRDRERERMQAVAARVRAGARRPRVAVLEWIDPWMGAGSWLPELIERAGGCVVLGEGGRHSEWTSFDAIRREDPDVVVISPCGFDLARTRLELTRLPDPGWSTLRAFREGRAFLADGNRHFHRPGPRIAETLEILAEILHEELRFGHEGSGFERFAPAA